MASRLGRGRAATPVLQPLELAATRLFAGERIVPCACRAYLQQAQLSMQTLPARLWFRQCRK